MNRLRDELTDPTDITQARKRSLREDRIFVFVIENPPEIAGREIELKLPGIIGRSRDVDMVIPEKSVSRKHAFIELKEEGALTIKDLNSTNGTFVNGKKIVLAKILPGDLITLGRVEMRLESRSYAEHIRRKKQKIEAILDPLTHLYNRRFFENEIKNLILSDEKFSLIFIDVDDLKKINDLKGHIEGDKALKELAASIKISIRQTDIAARYGGDEFVILVKGASGDVAEKIAHRIKEKISFDFSFGISEFPEDGKEPEEIIKKADERLYMMKRKKKDGKLWRVLG
jgi:diguanylate cyclase (GGDEF)-like protein